MRRVASLPFFRGYCTGLGTLRCPRCWHAPLVSHFFPFGAAREYHEKTPEMLIKCSTTRSAPDLNLESVLSECASRMHLRLEHHEFGGLSLTTLRRLNHEKVLMVLGILREEVQKVAIAAHGAGKAAFELLAESNNEIIGDNDVEGQGMDQQDV
ncbi:uncharacterized protein EI97DRAFT_499487, partial [Westerdykella ornata]